MFSRAYWAARIMPSMPRPPKPPGTRTPPQPARLSRMFSAVRVSESTQRMVTVASWAVPAWCRASTTER